MAKRRSSLSGRGAEILFGEPASVEIEPLGVGGLPPEESPPEPASAPSGDGSGPPPPTPEEESWDEEQIKQGLDDEVLAASAGSGEGDDSKPPPEEPALTPEEEMGLFYEASIAEEPTEPAVEEISPPMEVTMDEQNLQEEVALTAPPPEEGNIAADDLLPERTVTGYFDLGDMEPLATYDIQESEGTEPLELPDLDLSPEEEQVLLRRWGSARLRALDEEISKVYEQVLSKVGENEDIATDCYNKLLKARDIVIRREAARIPQAEYYVAQVRARLKRATESEVKAKKYAWKITGWGFLWVVIFLGALVTLNLAGLASSVQSLWDLQVDMEVGIFLSAMLWGGLGGVVAVWYSLFKHVGRRDFDSQYNLSYVGKPFLGLVLGATVYMLFHLLLTLGLLPAGLRQEGNAAASSSALVTPWIIYPIAWASGFKENRIFDLVDRVMKRIFSGEKKGETETPPPEQPTEPAE